MIYEHPVRLVYERSGFDLEKESYEELAAEWHEGYAAGIKAIELHEDTRDALQTVKSKGISQSILSALPHPLLLEGIEFYSLNPYFVEVSGIDDYLARSKIENGHRLMTKLNANPADTLIIGDTTHDVETAQALGTHCMLVSRGFEDEERLRRHGYPVFDSFETLLKAAEETF